MSANSATAAPRGWYYGWNIVAACILSQTVANGLTYNAFSLFLRDWSTQLNTPISRLTLGVAGMALVAALSAPVVGVLADKYPARRLFVGGLLGMATFYVAISAVTATWQFLALYAVLAPLSLVFSTAVPANALITRWFVRRRGLALGLSAFGIGLAGAVLPPLLAALLPTVGWRIIWRGGGVLIAAVVVPIMLLVIRNQPTERDGLHYLSGADNESLAPHGHASGAGQLSWRAVLARKNFWLLVAIFLPMMALNGASGQNIAPYAASHGLSEQSAGVLLSVLSVSHLVATLVLGLLSDRFGNSLSFAVLAGAMTVGAAFLAFGTGIAAIAVGCAFVGLGGGVFTLLAAAIAVEFGAAGMGRAFGCCMFFIPLASLAPFALAKTQESTGSYAPALLGMGILVVIAGLLSLTLRERRATQANGVDWHPAASEGLP
jgi:MFS family permease